MKKPKAFVLMPFDKEFNDVYKHLIHDPLSEAGYDVKRADNLLNQRNILKDIIESIISSDLIVADLTATNPNVYYELGIAHSRGKNVIMISQDIEELPFDLLSYRVILYSIHFTKMEDAKQEIKKLIKDVLDGNVKFGNPVSDFDSLYLDSSTSDTQSQVISASQENQDDLGLIDYSIEFEDNINIMTEIITGVGDGCATLAPEMETAFFKIGGIEKGDPRKQRKTLRELASKLNTFTAWLQNSNGQYREALGKSGQSLDIILSGEFDITEENMADLAKFIQELNNTETAMSELRNSCKYTIEAMDSIPKIEHEFHRAKLSMSDEFKILIDNINQTESMTIRARNAVERFT